MSEITAALYSSLGITYGSTGVVPAGTNSFTQAADEDGDGNVTPDEVYAEVFAHRYTYQPSIEALHRAGLEDPLQVTPEVTDRLQMILALSLAREAHSPITPAIQQQALQILASRQSPDQEDRAASGFSDFQMAILIFRAMIPESVSVYAPDPQDEWTEEITGLSVSQGSLQLTPNDDIMEPSRVGDFGSDRGNLTPNEILALPVRQRTAMCLEVSQLLVCMLRAAGIQADIRIEPNHAYVIARLDGVSYRLDAMQYRFERDTEQPNSESQSIAAHYYNEGTIFLRQGNLPAAIESFSLATEIEPHDARAWRNLGVALGQFGNGIDALDCYARALSVTPNDPHLVLRILTSVSELFDCPMPISRENQLRIRSLIEPTRQFLATLESSHPGEDQILDTIRSLSEVIDLVELALML